MKKIVTISLFVLFIIYTVLIKFVDVRSIGPNGSLVGFSTINKALFEFIGVNLIFYNITDWLGIIPVLIAFIFFVVGLIQLIKRKSLKKVDKRIICLGIVYFIVVVLYIFFEYHIVNYRPILMDGYLEASYPSSHTMITISIMGCTLLFFKKSKTIKILCIILIAFTIFGRMISGVHWFTDIIGGIILGFSTIMLYDTLTDKALN